MPFATIEAALEDFARGEFVILVDDEDRENEGDLAFAAEFVTPEKINFMAQEGRGLICVPMTGERLDELELPLMVPPDDNTTSHGTAFTVSVDAKHGTSTGISAADRAASVRALADPATLPEDLVRPGHMFPLRAAENGVLERGGQTEASVDMARLSGCRPVAVICEIVGEDGSMSRRPQLEAFAKRHGIKIVTVADLVAYRLRTETLTELAADTRLPTPQGDFRMRLFVDREGKEHVALTCDHRPEREPIVRVHSECLTGDALGSLRCDCGAQLRDAQSRVMSHGHGAVIYLREEGRGLGLKDKLRAYALQDEGLDTVEANEKLNLPADPRDYRVAASILRQLGYRSVTLLTNNPAKVSGLERFGVPVRGREPLVVASNEHNERYLASKREKMGHLLPDGAVAEVGAGR